ncbi:MAG: signal recognition particle-docking protein FtsY [Gammaproteobacteria bacterium]|jgi:fused signal recognition particle receptor
MLFGKRRPVDDKEKPNLWQNLQSGLSKTRAALLTDVRDLLKNNDFSSTEILEELESRLLMADVGVESTSQIIDALKLAIKKQSINSAEDVLNLLHDQMVEILSKIECPINTHIENQTLSTFLVVGVNGAGKTTSIGKLANLYKKNNKLLLVAADTFRAAAIEQLRSWGDNINIPVVFHSHGADSAAVIYDGLIEAKKIGANILIADTAGRLQNKSNLMDELKKIRRIIGKFDSDMPVEILLVLDASNGQNALVQAQQFHSEIGISGIILTKLDGTAKGGIVFALATKLKLPLHFICTGEKISDISPFNAEHFVAALLNQNK